MNVETGRSDRDSAIAVVPADTAAVPRPSDQGKSLRDAVLEQRARRRDRSPKTVLERQAAFLRPRKPRGRVAFWLAVTWIALVVFAAVFADVLPLRPYAIIVDNLPSRLAPRFSFTEPLGTDVIGRSVISRLAFGARQSLIVALASTTIAMSAGLTLGLVAGYFRGIVDEIVGILVDAVLCIPALVLLIAIASVGKRDITTVIFGLSLVGTPTFARLARANTILLVDREYVTAARTMGAGHLRIILRELLPNVVLPLSSFAFLFMAIVVVAEGSLSFLGLGIPPPSPSWGGMVNDSRAFLSQNPYLVFIPAACLLLTVLAFTVIGDRARRHFDVRDSSLA